MGAGAGAPLPNTQAVKDWVGTLIARFVHTTTQTVTPDINPPLVGHTTLKSVTMLSHCLVGSAHTQDLVRLLFYSSVFKPFFA